MTNVKHKKGDVLKALKDGKVSAVLHVCNSHGHMNSGFAKQVRTQYPKEFNAYENTIGDNGRIKMGVCDHCVRHIQHGCPRELWSRW